jgi:3-deoxy-D-manno-octulosonic-acid transferase
MILFYRLFLVMYATAIRVAALVSPKAKKWIAGRRNWRNQLQSFRNKHQEQKLIWMHCASLGEFEQGRPVLEVLREKYPNNLYLLTFFSPSGYEIRKNYPGADFVMYLPLDSSKNALDFVDIANPTLAVFIKYEFWHFYLKNLHQRHITTLLVSGIFRSSQPFFQHWGGFHLNMLKCFHTIFVQDQDSAELLKKTGIDVKTIISGDTRFDRVIEIASKAEEVAFAEFLSQKCLVAGSTWKEDEVLLAEWHRDNPDWQLVIVPHEIHATRIEEIHQIFPGAINLTSLQNGNIPTPVRVFIIDQIGLLSRLYRYGGICYVGGGFSGNGHHNILEAAVYGKAVVTGPNYQKFRESVELKKIGGSFAVTNADELNALTSGEERLSKAGIISREYVLSKAGATESILSYIQEKRLLTNA